MPRYYNIHDNGNKPFLVVLDKNIATVYTQKFIEETEKYVKNKELFSTPYERVFIGDNKLNIKEYIKKGKFRGNSILLNIDKNNYIYIGSEIYKFKTIDGLPITDFYSPVGNSDVPYPYAVSKEKVYFMLDKEVLPSELLNLKQDGYGQFYGYNSDLKIINKRKAPFKVKMIANMNF